MSLSEEMGIPTEAHTDDWALQARFDAEPYFAQATDDELATLAACGYGGDYPAHDVAHWFEDQDEDLRVLFAYLELRNRGAGEVVGFECHVDEERAGAWIQVHRPALWRRLNDVG